MIKTATSPRSAPRKGSPTSNKGASLPATQCTPRLRGTATIANTKKVMEGVRKLIKTKRTPNIVDADVYRGFDDKRDPYMLARVGRNVGEV